jgi:hypothetical protein
VKKILVLAVGLGVVLGTISFAQDTTDTTKKMTSKKKQKKAKTTDTTATTK